jgi:hypothetical protein
MEKKTQSITVTQYDFIIRNDEDERLNDQGYPHHHTEFDLKGNTLKDTRYDDHGAFEEMFEYFYDDRGNMVRELYYPAESELAEEKTFEYDDSDTTTYEYNSGGKPARLVTTNDEGDVDQVETFDWDNDKLIDHQIVDGNGELIPAPDFTRFEPAPSRITHNDKGQVVREEEVDSDGEVYMTVNRSYHEDGLADEVDVFIDGRERTITRHYLLKYQYTFFE